MAILSKMTLSNMIFLKQDIFPESHLKDGWDGMESEEMEAFISQSLWTNFLFTYDASPIGKELML